MDGLAKLGVLVAAGLPLHLAGRQPARDRAELPQPHADHAAGRAVARRQLALHHLGWAAWRVSGAAARARRAATAAAAAAALAAAGGEGAGGARRVFAPPPGLGVLPLPAPPALLAPSPPPLPPCP